MVSRCRKTKARELLAFLPERRFFLWISVCVYGMFSGRTGARPSIERHVLGGKLLLEHASVAALFLTTAAHPP